MLNMSLSCQRSLDAQASGLGPLELRYPCNYSCCFSCGQPRYLIKCIPLQPPLHHDLRRFTTRLYQDRSAFASFLLHNFPTSSSNLRPFIIEAMRYVATQVECYTVSLPSSTFPSQWASGWIDCLQTTILNCVEDGGYINCSFKYAGVQMEYHLWPRELALSFHSIGSASSLLAWVGLPGVVYHGNAAETAGYFGFEKVGSATLYVNKVIGTNNSAMLFCIGLIFCLFSYRPTQAAWLLFYQLHLVKVKKKATSYWLNVYHPRAWYTITQAYGHMITYRPVLCKPLANKMSYTAGKCLCS